MDCNEFQYICRKWAKKGLMYELADLLDISFGDLVSYECGIKPVPMEIAEKIKKIPLPKEVNPKVTVKWYQLPIWETIGEILQFLCFILFFIPLVIVYVGCLFCGSGRK